MSPMRRVKLTTSIITMITKLIKILILVKKIVLHHKECLMIIKNGILQAINKKLIN